MRNVLKALLVICFTSGLGWGANRDNAPLGAENVRINPRQVDTLFLIRFSTTIPANTDVVLAPDHWATYNSTFTNITWPAGVTYSTSPASNNGGRSYLYFQYLESASGVGALPYTETQRLHWDFNTTVSTNTSPYLRMGESFPPQDFMFVYQSTVTVRSTATVKIGGFMITEKSRR